MELLINLDDDIEATAPKSLGPPTPKSADTFPKPVHRDSFSDLADLMRAKRSYTPIPTPSSRLTSPLPTNSPRFSARKATSSSVLSPLAKSFRQSEISNVDMLEQQVVSPDRSDLPGLEHQRQYTQSLSASSIQNTQSDIWHDSGADSSEAEQSRCQSPQEVSNNSYKRGPMPGYFLSAHTKEKLQEEIGILRFRYETDKDQISAMIHSLSLKDEHIRNLQLENKNLIKDLAGCGSEVKKLGGVIGENEYLRATLASMEKAREHTLQNISTENEKILDEARFTIRRLEEKNKRLEEERQVLTRASAAAEEYRTQAQDLSKDLMGKDNLIMDLRLEKLNERMKVADLEEDIKELERKCSQEDAIDLKEKLERKTSQCHQMHKQLKGIEQELKVSQERALKVGNLEDSLRNAAHLVRPNPNTKLPKKVFSCLECFAKHLECDNNTQCSNCSQTNAECRRWRCSLLHRLGTCPTSPCNPTHDAQGWLCLQEKRPEW